MQNSTLLLKSRIGGRIKETTIKKNNTKMMDRE
jgi:hypothetical protein